MADQAIEKKNQGNAAFQAGNYPEAVKLFSEAIELDGSNHVFYSNRSGAYAGLGQWQEALNDANKTVEMKPDWAKGYSRVGAAHHGLGNFEEAIGAFKKGLEVDPSNAALQSGLAEAEKAQSQNASNPFAKMFGPDLIAKMAGNPSLAPLLSQPDLMMKLQQIQQNPNTIGQHLQDPRIQMVMQALMGIQFSNGADDLASKAEPLFPKEEPKKEPEPPAPEPELSDEQKAEKAKRDEADAEKAKGNDLYKAKKFDEAVIHYDKAFEIFPDLTYRNNKATALFEKGDLDTCLKVCEEAIQWGREHRADYKLIAKTFGRKGKALAKQQKFTEAIAAFETSMVEHKTPDVARALQEAKKNKKEAELAAYLSPEISQQEREKGNEFFKNQQYPEAIKHYTEAINRNPEDHIPLSNRAAAYTKLGEFKLAEADCDKALELNSTFVKAIVRKGHVQFYMKEYHKCIETYAKALQLEPDNQEAKDGQQRTMYQIQQQQMNGPDEDAQRRAMQDPEIQGIMGDPVMQQILKDMSTDPAAAKDHMQNPGVAAKINKLIAAGIIRTG